MMTQFEGFWYTFPFTHRMEMIWRLDDDNQTDWIEENGEPIREQLLAEYLDYNY